MHHRFPIELKSDVKRATDLKVLQPVIDIRHMGSLITHKNRALGESPPRPLLRAIIEGLIKHMRGGKIIIIPK